MRVRYTIESSHNSKTREAQSRFAGRSFASAVAKLKQIAEAEQAESYDIYKLYFCRFSLPTFAAVVVAEASIQSAAEYIADFRCEDSKSFVISQAAEQAAQLAEAAKQASSELIAERRSNSSALAELAAIAAEAAQVAERFAAFAAEQASAANRFWQSAAEQAAESAQQADESAKRIAARAKRAKLHAATLEAVEAYRFSEAALQANRSELIAQLVAEAEQAEAQQLAQMSAAEVVAYRYDQASKLLAEAQQTAKKAKQLCEQAEAAAYHCKAKVSNYLHSAEAEAKRAAQLAEYNAEICEALPEVESCDYNSRQLASKILCYNMRAEAYSCEARCATLKIAFIWQVCKQRSIAQSAELHSSQRAEAVAVAI